MTRTCSSVRLFGLISTTLRQLVVLKIVQQAWEQLDGAGKWRWKAAYDWRRECTLFPTITNEYPDHNKLGRSIYWWWWHWHQYQAQQVPFLLESQQTPTNNHSSTIELNVYPNGWCKCFHNQTTLPLSWFKFNNMSKLVLICFMLAKPLFTRIQGKLCTFEWRRSDLTRKLFYHFELGLQMMKWLKQQKNLYDCLMILI